MINLKEDFFKKHLGLQKCISVFLKLNNHLLGIFTFEELRQIITSMIEE